MRADRYQYSLIALGLLSTAMLLFFFYRELFPEYRQYQKKYMALEEFRSGYTHEPVPPFKEGIKQIVHEPADNGPADVQRCTSCHLALDLNYFSPTALKYDANGSLLRDEEGVPVKEVNKEFIWAKLDQKIEELRDQEQTDEAAALEQLKTVEVGDQTYDVTRVLAMHPLIGKETRPFEFHPLDEYGCTVCHNGNGIGLTTEKAHGPIYDGQYEAEFIGYKPQFVELDEENDPPFSHVFNDKPSDRLLFQTTPLFVGATIEAKCMQCHQSTASELQTIKSQSEKLILQQQKEVELAEESVLAQENLATSFLILLKLIEEKGAAGTEQYLLAQGNDYSLTEKERKASQAQAQWLLVAVGGEDGLQRQDSAAAKDLLKEIIVNELTKLTGGKELAQELIKKADLLPAQRADIYPIVALFTKENISGQQANGGALFLAQKKAASSQQLLVDLQKGTSTPSQPAALLSDIDRLTSHYHQGEQLFVGQACYACHKIAGLARGGVGPDLTYEGNVYPWYIKEKMVWPQFDLKTSTMPNFKLDHEELENLMAFLLKQKGEDSLLSPVNRKIALQRWEGGERLPWERALTPAQIHDVENSMIIFATEGCAACHRLKGFTSDIGYKAEEKEPVDGELLQREHSWFQSLFPEMATGSQIVEAIDGNKEEIDRRLAKVRTNSILEKIDKKAPGLIGSFYASFKYAFRAKNSFYKKKIEDAKNAEEKERYRKEWAGWRSRVENVLMVFIQEYGLGRLIGPRPNWSGIFRTDEWLMEHFKNPSAHTPRSIMPIFPFDDTKFYALTYMLDHLAIQNRDSFNMLWQKEGFDPSKAFQLLCSQCHGVYQQGNGPVAEWIYPIPKNLRNAEFLRDLTPQQATLSITHGVKGTPMPPWGEVASDKKAAKGSGPMLTHGEIAQIVAWLYEKVPGTEEGVEKRAVPKWNYTPEKILEELKKEHRAKNLLKIEEKGAAPAAAPAAASAAASGISLSLFHPLSNIFSLPIPLHNRARDGDDDEDALTVENIFNTVTTPASKEEKEQTSYYIKKELYTPENLGEGKRLFEMDCAYCHGQQADGAGARADAMQEAKPRMLINLDWLQTRDDLRLLRSIKYGVSGTAMTPWGDMTTALQRLQLVMYIRSLSSEKEKRESLLQGLYRAFYTAVLTVEKARIGEYKELEAKRKAALELEEKNKSFIEKGLGQSSDNSALIAALQQLALVKKEIEAGEAKDTRYKEIKKLLVEQQKAYEEGGLQLMPHADEVTWNKYLKLVALNENHFKMDQKGALRANKFPEAEAKLLEKEILEAIEKELQLLEQKEEEEKQKEKAKEALAKLKNHLIEAFTTAARTRQAEDKALTKVVVAES